MKTKVLNNINNNISALKKITINPDKGNYWELNVLLDKYYAMRNLIHEDVDIDYEKITLLILNLEDEITAFSVES